MAAGAGSFVPGRVLVGFEAKEGEQGRRFHRHQERALDLLTRPEARRAFERAFNAQLAVFTAQGQRTSV
mgnify:CR=1 FL=1